MRSNSIPRRWSWFGSRRKRNARRIAKSDPAGANPIRVAALRKTPGREQLPIAPAIHAQAIVSFKGTNGSAGPVADDAINGAPIITAAGEAALHSGDRGIIRVGGL